MKAIAHVLTIFAAVLALAACATTAQTVNQSLLAAATLNNTVLTTVDGLVRSGTVSAAQAQAALAITDDVQAALTLANTAAQAGQTATVTAKLAAVTGALAAVQNCLAGASANLVACLQGIAPP